MKIYVASCEWLLSSLFKINRTITSNDKKTTKKDTDNVYPNKMDDSTATYLQETTVSLQREIDTIDNNKVVLFALIPASFFVSGVLTMLFIICKRSKPVNCFLTYLTQSKNNPQVVDIDRIRNRSSQ